MTEPPTKPRANKTDAGNGTNGICRVSTVLRSPSPEPNRKKIRAISTHAMRVEKRIEDEDGENEWPPDDFTGVWEIYWRSGGLKFRSSYECGQEEGEQVCWWENGKLAQRGLKVHGKSYGVWTDYSQDGHKTLEGRFGPEGKESLWCTYWSNGQVMHEDEWRAGKQHGASRAFDSDGRLLYAGEFRNDEPFSGICKVRTWDAAERYYYLAEFQNGCEIRKVPKNG